MELQSQYYCGIPVFKTLLTTLLFIAVTGGVQLDGVVDCADAWVGGLGDRECTLLLLKDLLCGSMG